MGGVGDPEQQYSLRWNDFHASILSSFRHLRDQEDFVDVTLACDGCSFTAHKVVLSACSPYFRTLLKANPCQHPIVILRDVREQDMEALLRFMYNGEVHIGQEQLTDFLKTAQTLQVRGLADVPTKDHQKLLPTSNCLPWSTAVNNDTSSTMAAGDGAVTPPPTKRSRSSELPPSAGGHHPTARGFSPSPSPGSASLNAAFNDHGGRDSMLGHALESSTPTQQHNSNNNNNNQLKGSDSSMHAHSTGEESNSSDTALSDRGGLGGGVGSGIDLVTPKSEPQEYSSDHHNSHNNSLILDPSRNPNFPAALLGLPGIPGLLPGPSGMHNNSQDNNFVSRRGLDLMRVRATDPRPCPKCGKIYRSAHTLRTHLEDKHTVCPGYRCVLCGTVAKSRNSLHSHMSRQHRGISTKDLPVLPMPSPFDPELASRLLAKAGVKVSAAELRARSSPTGPPRRSDTRLELKSSGSSVCGGDDPEDLTMHNHAGAATHRYGSLEVSALSPPPLLPPHPPSALKDLRGFSTGSAILQEYLQLIADNSAGFQLSAEQAAKMAAKMSEEQQRLENHHRLLDANHGGDSSGGEDDEEYSDDEQDPPPPPQPEPIKAE
ncbi:protein abrupt [Nilaparvata lugens]|uniref:protein abrupt n=1 Tax=Nilaparvata lugens TaxID=108931 RepID=UPI00193D0C0A|nr:protein abrupt [Nilaparvata lugens]XP_039279650.1 protein abrupt [Nilaparvata lugens]XP_039279651.1 protein abrupt [Nilaparvata lugens]XP_039279652.1 protein abrupt [Nilaparvata lugens]